MGKIDEDPVWWFIFLLDTLPPHPRNETLTCLWELNRVSPWPPGAKGTLFTFLADGIALPVLKGWESEGWCSEGNTSFMPLAPAFFYSAVGPLMRVSSKHLRATALPWKLTDRNGQYLGLCPSFIRRHGDDSSTELMVLSLDLSTEESVHFCKSHYLSGWFSEEGENRSGTICPGTSQLNCTY